MFFFGKLSLHFITEHIVGLFTALHLINKSSFFTPLTLKEHYKLSIFLYSNKALNYFKLSKSEKVLISNVGLIK